MMVYGLKRIEHTWKYRTHDGQLVSFEECTIGKYKGITFMSVYSEDETGICEEYLLAVTKEIAYRDMEKMHGNGFVRLLEKVEVDEKHYDRTEVFFSIARKTKFTIDGEQLFEGYTFNRYWNGWECPYFTKDVAMEVCKEFSYKYDDDEECRCFYDEETDKFYCEDYNSDYERELIGTPTTIKTEDGELKVYYFGGSWIWSEYEEYESQ